MDFDLGVVMSVLLDLFNSCMSWFSARGATAQASHALKGNLLAQENLSVTTRGLIAEHLAKYRNELNLVKRDTVIAREHLREQCRRVIDDLMTILRGYPDCSNGQPIRHLFHESWMVVCESFECWRELGISPWNFYYIRHVQDDIQRENNDFEFSDDEAEGPTLHLNSSRRLLFRVSTICKTLSYTEQQDVFQKCVAAHEKFFEYLRIHSDECDSLKKKLQQCYYENSCDEFKIAESRSLDRALKKEIDCLNSIGRFSIMGQHGISLSSWPIAEVLYIGSIPYCLMSMLDLEWKEGFAL